MKIHKITHNILFTQINYMFFKRHVPNIERKFSYSLHKYYSTQSEEKSENVIPVENIRNFSIIAHIDHGKSTLADRLLEMTGAIKKNSGKQVLDKLKVEKDRGITVKAQTASLNYTYKGVRYMLNLIDTPGHVDFSAEVHRSLAPCQGVVLLVDANDGVQAQTVANFYLASKRNLVIVPVINKIDLKNADPERVEQQINKLFNIDENILKISAKLGIGIEKVLDAIIERIPPPTVFRDKPFRALIFDSWYNKYKGPVSLIYIKEGVLSLGQSITSIITKKSYKVCSLSLLRPEDENVNKLFAGQIGCLTCNMKSSKEAIIGDTLHLKDDTVEPLMGFKQPKPMLFAGVYPVTQSEFEALKTAIEKLMLNDNAVSPTPDTSVALGRGWRIGFLGLLHMEVFIQRLEQEYGAQPIVTVPNVTYKAKIIGTKNISKYGGEMLSFSNPALFPDPVIVSEFYEPMVIGTIVAPEEYLGNIMDLCFERRGVKQTCTQIGNSRLMIQFILPLNEIIVDFHDTLKCVTSGYASFDYEDFNYQTSDIAKINIALNGTVVEELSTIVHASKARSSSRRLCLKLADIIPRQLFEIVIQAIIGGKVIARESIKPYRKDVTAKLYGGDVTRRMKLLAQQAKGKKHMKMVGKIALPRETFINVLKR